MFNDSKISLGKARVETVNVQTQGKDMACTARVTLSYKPLRRNREWFIVFLVRVDSEGVVVSQLLDYLYKRTALHTEILGLGSWFPLIDNIKFALGLNIIQVKETDIRVLKPYSKPVLVK